MSGLRLETGQDKALEGAGMCVIFGICGVCVCMCTPRSREDSSSRARRQGERRWLCCVKETWCKVPVFSRRKEKHVEMF